MKRCPECRRDYYDDTLIYCLDDGSALLEGPASGSEHPTVLLQPDEATDDLGIRVLPSPNRMGRSPSNRSLWVASIAAGVVVLALAAFALYRYFPGAGRPQTIRAVAVLPLEN